MARSLLPFHYHATAAAQQLLGGALPRVAMLAIRTVIKNRKSVEVAHQQLSYRGHAIALASRVTASGDLVVEIDIGDPRLAHHVVLEDDFRAASRDARDRDTKQREAERKLRQRRW